MTVHELNLAVFVSGSGSNFQAILDEIRQGTLDAKVALCISDKPAAKALERARANGIPTDVLSPNAFATEDEYAAAMLETLNRHGANFIALAGFLRKIPSQVVRAFRNRMLNIHPALLPAFGGHGMFGKRVHEAVLAYGARWTGVTVHLVDEEYDTGPVVLQEPVRVLQDDTPETLAARVLEMEHQLYPAALRLFAESRITVEERKVRIADTSLLRNRP